MKKLGDTLWAFYQKYPVIVAFIAVLPLLYFPIFYRLDRLPILLWDESRQAINTYEMAKSGNLFITTYEGAPDHYNTKPPLLIWFQSFFWVLMDNKELALRLPSALAALFTCFSFVWFTKKMLNNAWIGALAAFILISIDGYIDLHASRTGDYDALLTLFSTLFLMHFFIFIIKNTSKNLAYFYLFLGLAIAVKAAAPLMFLPGLLLSSIIFKRFREIVLSKQTYQYSLLLFGIIGVFYGIRMGTDAGYAAAVWHNDFGGRFLNTIDSHSESFEYYALQVWGKKAVYIAYLLPLLLITFFKMDSTQRKLILYALLNGLLFLLFISIAQTKIYWYAVPLYPIIALIVAVSASAIASQLKRIHLALSASFLVVLAGFIAIYPYQANLNKSIETPYFDWEGKAEFYQQSIYLKQIIDKERTVNDLTVLNRSNYAPHNNIYINLINDQFGYEKIKKLDGDTFILKKNEEILYMPNAIKTESLSRYQFKTLHRFGVVLHRKVLGDSL